MTRLDSYLEERLPLINRALDEGMPAGHQPPAVLHQAMRHAVLSGGKRLRPVLCIAACEAVGGTAPDCMKAAVAIEYLHAYTLVHDDLPCMDDDKTRRGKPTVHVAFGEANAVLAGDALQALAFETLAACIPRPPCTSGLLVHELACAAGSLGIVAGQFEDMAAKGSALGPEQLRYIHLRKTALLFRAAARLGAMCAGAAPADLEALGEYGENLGLAFQMADDILDGENVEDASKAALNARGITDQAQSAIAAIPDASRWPLDSIAELVLQRARKGLS